MKLATAEDLAQADSIRRALTEGKDLLKRFFDDKTKWHHEQVLEEARKPKADLVVIARHAAMADVYSRLMFELEYLTKV